MPSDRSVVGMAQWGRRTAIGLVGCMLVAIGFAAYDHDVPTGESTTGEGPQAVEPVSDPSPATIRQAADDGTRLDRAPEPLRLDPRCERGRALCADKSTNTLRWVVDGEIRRTVAARFGGPKTPTREGMFRVYDKLRHHLSSLYGTPMPFAMFFSRGQAVHYSKDFRNEGYDGASHGCINVRNNRAMVELFHRVRIGDKVIVYRS
jgi:lipoprotein-anchoring transpeptidase ErfK/SrfK